jgi:hypothetical protein
LTEFSSPVCVLSHPQAYTGDALDTKAASKEVDTAALTALMTTLGVDGTAQPARNLGWIAGPIIGGLAGLALLGVGAWYLVMRAKSGGLPVSFSAAGTDAGLRLPRVADKYAVGQSQEQAASDGGTPTSATQVQGPSHGLTARVGG